MSKAKKTNDGQVTEPLLRAREERFFDTMHTCEAKSFEQSQPALHTDVEENNSLGLTVIHSVLRSFSSSPCSQRRPPYHANCSAVLYIFSIYLFVNSTVFFLYVHLT